MKEQGSQSRVVRFATFEFDLGAGELRKNGLRIKLNGQPISLLALLIERSGELVTREELQRRLWPADTYVDFEHSLNAVIKRLRVALIDSADSPRFIETIPRQGYRFIAPIHHLPPIPASVEKLYSKPGVDAPELDKGASKPSRWWHYLLVLAAVLALLVGAGFRDQINEYFWRNPVADARLQTITDF